MRSFVVLGKQFCGFLLIENQIHNCLIVELTNCDNIEARVIKPAQKALDNSCPYTFTYSKIKANHRHSFILWFYEGEGKAGDDFWVKAETLLYCALIGYIHYEAPVEEQNFSTLIEFINAMEVREDDEEFKNPVDLMFDAWNRYHNDSFSYFIGSAS